MGLLSGLGSLLFGGASGAGPEAAQQANVFSQRAIDELRREFDVSREDIAPFIGAGVGQLPQLIQGTTPGGLDARLEEIFGTDVFQELVGERTRAVEGQLAAGGLTRSGAAIQEAANIPTDIGLALESLLTGRSANLAGMGQSATFGQANLGAQTSASIANLLTQQGQNISSGILTAQQEEAAKATQTANLITTAAGIFFGRRT